jgi:hypothetical protein
MSNKRKLEDNCVEDSDDCQQELPSISGSSDKRKAEEESVDDKERNELREWDKKYEMRYTLSDNEYKQCIERSTVGSTVRPPLLTHYFGKNKNRDHFRPKSHQSFNNRGRDQRSTHRSDFNYRNNNNWNQNNRSFNSYRNY